MSVAATIRIEFRADPARTGRDVYALVAHALKQLVKCGDRNRGLAAKSVLQGNKDANFIIKCTMHEAPTAAGGAVIGDMTIEFERTMPATWLTSHLQHIAPHSCQMTVELYHW